MRPLLIVLSIYLSGAIAGATAMMAFLQIQGAAMARKQNDFHYIENHLFEDEKLHNEILDDGDHAAAKKVSDQVARDVGLSPAEIEALSAPPKKAGAKKGNGK
jgi:hypothetical protein